MSYITLRGRWCDIIVLNVGASTEDKSNHLGRVSDKFPKYHMKILFSDFNESVRREGIFKSAIGNESLHEISNDWNSKFFHIKISSCQEYNGPTSQHS
jgi:hypothetical protein